MKSIVIPARYKRKKNNFVKEPQKLQKPKINPDYLAVSRLSIAQCYSLAIGETKYNFSHLQNLGDLGYKLDGLCSSIAAKENKFIAATYAFDKIFKEEGYKVCTKIYIDMLAKVFEKTSEVYNINENKPGIQCEVARRVQARNKYISYDELAAIKNFMDNFNAMGEMLKFKLWHEKYLEEEL